MSIMGDRRRAIVRGGERAERVASIARAMGIEVVAEGPAELAILETDDPAVVAAAGAPALILVPRRLWAAQTKVLEDAGARRIVEGDATVLDVLVAVTEILFSTCAEQRRWWKRGPGLALELSSPAGSTSGRLVGLTRTGVMAQLASPIAADARVEIAIDTPAGRATVHGRVAYSADDAVAIELDLCDPDATGKIERLTPRRVPRGASVRRSL